MNLMPPSWLARTGYCKINGRCYCTTILLLIALTLWMLVCTGCKKPTFQSGNDAQDTVSDSTTELPGYLIYANSADEINWDFRIVNDTGGVDTLLPAYFSAKSWPVVSPDLSKISYLGFQFITGVGGVYSCFISNFDGSGTVEFARNATSGFSWSRDGQNLYYSKWGGIWVGSPGGVFSQQLSDSGSGDHFPSLNQNQSKIVFLRGSWPGSRLWTMNANGSNKQLLAFDLHGMQDPACSPTDNRLLFVATGTNSFPHVFLADLDNPSVEPVQLTTGSSWNYGPCWSPDGRHFAFSSRRTGETDYYIFRAPIDSPLNVDQVTFRPGSSMNANWVIPPEN